MIYFAHRGYSSKYPENTLLAFDKALSAGAQAVEFDVHKTKDNKLVVIHDENIKRTFNGSGLIKDLTLAELKTYSSNNPEYKDSKLCKIPTLDQVLELLLSYNIIINLEIKTDIIQYENIEKEILDTINHYNLEEKVIISSFNHKSLEKCRDLSSTIRLGMLFDNKIKGIVEAAKALNAYSLHPNFKLVDEELMKVAHENNLKVFAYTVNSPLIAKALEALNCDGIFTDDIKKFL